MNTVVPLNIVGKDVMPESILPLDLNLDEMVTPADQAVELQILKMANEELRKQVQQLESARPTTKEQLLILKVKKQAKLLALMKKRCHELENKFAQSQQKVKLLKNELNEIKDEIQDKRDDIEQPISQVEPAELKIPLEITDQLEELKANQALLIESQKDEKNKIEQMLAESEQQQVWRNVHSTLPTQSGIYLLTDSERQCFGYYNHETESFSATTFFKQPTHWMPQPDLPK